MLAASRAFFWISTFLAVLVSAGLASACGYAVGSGLTELQIVLWPWSPIYWSVGCAWMALLKSAVAVAAVAHPLSGKAIAGALLFCLILASFNVFMAVATLGPASAPGTVLVSLGVLLIEVVSGYLPAFAYMTLPLRPCEDSGAQASPSATAPAVAAPSQSESSAVPPPRSFRELILFVRRCGSAKFPDIKLERDGSLFAGQRVFARAIGLSIGACNGRLKAEHRAGIITVTPTPKGTRIALNEGVGGAV